MTCLLSPCFDKKAKVETSRIAIINAVITRILACLLKSRGLNFFSCGCALDNFLIFSDCEKVLQLILINKGNPGLCK